MQLGAISTLDVETADGLDLQQLPPLQHQGGFDTGDMQWQSIHLQPLEAVVVSVSAKLTVKACEA
jgi:hypothetical protein